MVWLTGGPGCTSLCAIFLNILVYNVIDLFSAQYSLLVCYGAFGSKSGMDLK
ncbi:Serine carboxypeptidase-like 19 [Bienertia sinuspersici]